MISSQQYERLRELFEAVRDLPPPERDKVLDEKCADDSEDYEREAVPGRVRRCRCEPRR